MKENRVEAFREGSDIHAATAAKIWHEEISQVTDTQRKKAKTFRESTEKESGMGQRRKHDVCSRCYSRQHV